MKGKTIKKIKCDYCDKEFNARPGYSFWRYHYCSDLCEHNHFQKAKSILRDRGYGVVYINPYTSQIYRDPRDKQADERKLQQRRRHDDYLMRRYAKLRSQNVRTNKQRTSGERT